MLVTILIIHIVSMNILIAQQIDYKGFPQWSWHKEGVTEYYLYTPSNIEEGKQYPIAIFLHGCCGQDEHATLRNAVDPPVRMWHNFGQNTQVEPTFIISPKTTRGWKQKFPDLKKVVDDLITERKVDPQRIYMTGFSMGGGGTYQFIEEYPGYIAAAAPMGMRIRVDLEQLKDVPIWAVRGELDYHARSLPDEIGEIRLLNGDNRGGLDWVTGVNPRFSSFKGVGHGVQWDAVSNLDLLQWLYSKVNDGNIYPVVFFEEPEYMHPFHPGQTVNVKINASDPDGSIEKVELYYGDQLIKKLTEKPFQGQFTIDKGNSIVKGIAYDNQGKTSTTEMMIMGICLPEFVTSVIPSAIQGELYNVRLDVAGNAPFRFEAISSAEIPTGLIVTEDGTISGIPEKPGKYPVHIRATDRNSRKLEKIYNLQIKSKDKNTVIVSNVHSTADSLKFKVDKMRFGALPNTQVGTEVFFSDVGGYENLTYISTSQFANDAADDEVLFFTVDEDVTILVGYEIHDNLFESSIPGCVVSDQFEKTGDEQIIAQYFYFEVYKKDYPAGEIILPGANARSNGVMRNYFVMVQKSGK
ncbi:Ig-like domain-containing protein [Bacteroidota bacterium]